MRILDLEKVNQILELIMYIVIIIGAVWLLITVMGMKPDMMDLLYKIYRMRYWQEWYDYAQQMP